MLVERDINEDCNVDSDCLVTDYNDIDEAGFLTPSSTNEEDLFDEGRKNKMDVYNPRTNHTILKFKVGHQFHDVSERKWVVRKWAIHNGYGYNI